MQIAYRGIDSLDIAEDGSLDVNTAFGILRETEPRIYQEIGGKQVQIEGRFRPTGQTSYTFEIPAYNPDYPLIIDPTLLYSTFLGGSAGNVTDGADQEVATGVAVDASGNAYVTGYTASSDFPTTPGAFQTSPANNGQEIFVTKLNATGSALVYSTYLGGTWPANIAVDTAGNARRTGWSEIRRIN